MGGFCGTLVIRSWSQEMIIVIVCVNAYLYACAHVGVPLCVWAIGNWAHLPQEVLH